MKHPLSSFIFQLLTITLFTPQLRSAQTPSCNPTCGSLPIKYPFGTGNGCGSPRFHRYVSCSPTGTGDQLVLTTHTGTYPITSISYKTSTLTITPPSMSTCTSMQPSSNLGLDWAGPFQLGPSTFILLSCTPSTISSLTTKGGSLICDPFSSDLCSSIYTCPAVISFGLPLFPPTNTCCVYGPANFDTEGELDLHGLKCAGYASVVSLGDYPTDPARWEYGVALKYSPGGLDNYNTATLCEACERSEGVCGYTPPSNKFVCVCKAGFNSSSDCYSLGQVVIWSSNSPTRKKLWLGFWAGLIFLWSSLREGSL